MDRAGCRRAARRAPWSLGILLALAVPGWAPPPLSAQPLPAATEVRVAAPFEPRGLVAGLTVSTRAPGSCWTASLATAGRPDAWRCMSGNRIHDPCFVGFAGADQVAACLASPWASEVTLLVLSGPLPGDVTRPPHPLGGPPWALELASGERCTLLTGATWGVAGMRVNYGCPDDVSVVGDLDRSAPVWRAFVLRAGAAFMGQAAVRIAYY